MSPANEVRKRLAHVLLAIGALLFLFGVFSKSGWGFFASLLGVMLLAAGTIMVTSVSIISFAPWAVKLISRHTEPAWDGEIIHTDGGEYKIRYDFDHHGAPWFVAGDVCIAIGKKAPGKGMLKCGGTPLLLRGGNVCFSEENVQAYLIPLATHNHAANRLLVNIRNNVLRKLEKQRDEKRLYG